MDGKSIKFLHYLSYEYNRIYLSYTFCILMFHIFVLTEMERSKRIVGKPSRYETTSSDEVPKRTKIGTAKILNTNINDNIDDIRRILESNAQSNNNEHFDNSLTHIYVEPHTPVIPHMYTQPNTSNITYPCTFPNIRTVSVSQPVLSAYDIPQAECNNNKIYIELEKRRIYNMQPNAQNEQPPQNQINSDINVQSIEQTDNRYAN
ncbi:uncharacterized protein LOC112590165 [Harpegnathos saltator]|uniref:uncharacterized protein LOC112590165 n=1 Tax=Harpegnathos saltator TaxID=610380 RepID=UPI000DBED95A|nr:uncharacterized protein LOC112590165 [Harpegnathos saltator]